MSAHLSGIQPTFVSTKRLHTHLLECGSPNATPIVLLHGNLSSATFFEETMLDLSAQYRCIAPDMRGFGESESLPIDATRGLRDLADDLLELLDTLAVESAHLLGWSAGAGVIIQFAIDHADRVKSLILVSPVSPYGFGGTQDIHGTAAATDFSGSGGGTVSADVVEQLRLADPGSASPFAPRQLLRDLYVKPPYSLQREDVLVDAVYRTRVGDRFYPGDFIATNRWPHVAPGKWGLINAISPKYCELSGIVEIPHKPPILWVRGDEDVIVSDESLLDPVTHHDGCDLPPQPMVGQTREVLARYVANGGTAEEVVIAGTGHSPFIEKPTRFMASLCSFLQR